ncbi:MAG: hypothetical protein NVSMB47_22110 [Polyangiales bacterium]
MRASPLRLACTLAAVFLACGPRQPPATQQQVGGATVAPPAQGTPNAWCEAYCKRQADCWTTVPNSEPNKPPDQVIADCRAQTNGCQIAAATDAMCCSVQADCTNFAACVYSAKNVASSCQ